MSSRVALVGAIGVLLVVVLSAQRLGGADGYVTAPVGATALAAAAVLVELVRARLAAGGDDRSSQVAAALVLALVLLLLLSVVAVGLDSRAPGALASASVAVWSVAWVPPLVLSQLVASSAVRPLARSPRAHAVVVTTSGAAMLAGAILWQPSAPFAGVAPLAPESWPLRLAVVGDLATAAGLTGLMVLPITLGRAAATSRDGSRVRLGVAAAGTVAAPLVIVFCLALAIARDPGAVDPSVGSVAFVVAVAGGAAAGATCAHVVASGPGAGRVSLVIRVAALAVAALVVAAVGTLVVAAQWGPTATAITVSVLAVGATAAAWGAGGRLGASLARVRTPPAPQEVGREEVTPPITLASTPATPTTPSLTVREDQVLSHLADGASNAGIAAQLVISERTVDAHLRAIFTKLDLTPDRAANRRVQAARLWLDSRAGARPDSGSEPGHTG